MFFHFSQNNSGGNFAIDEDVAHHVIIESRNANEANRKAESIGIYFDGVDNGRDCDCCGDRWHSVWGQGDAEPLIYGDPPEQYVDMWAGKGEPYCHVYYLDGRKVTYRG
jgi:hypothetical protein